jgi:hypothetical protein
MSTAAGNNAETQPPASAAPGTVQPPKQEAPPVPAPAPKEEKGGESTAADMLGLAGGVKKNLRADTKNLQSKHNSHIPESLKITDEEEPPAPSTAPREVQKPQTTETPKPGESPTPPAAPGGKTEEPKGGKPADQPPASVTPSKVTINGKEYTVEELGEVLKKQEAPKPTETPTPAAVVPPKKEPTPEEIEKHKQEVKSRELKYINDNLAHVGLSDIGVNIDETLMEAIGNGGKEGAAALQDLLGRAVLKGVLLSRQSVYQDVNPKFDQVLQQVQPLIEAHKEQQYQAAIDDFKKTYPELEPHMKLANGIADSLIAQYPEWAGKVDQKGFFEEVARQVKAYVGDTPTAPQKVTIDGKEYTMEEVAAALKKGAAPVPATVESPATQTNPNPPALPRPPAPANNAPAVSGGLGGKPKGKDSRVQATLG